MSRLEEAIMEILGKATCIMTLADLNAHLVSKGWNVYDVQPRKLSEALIELTGRNLIRNVMGWCIVPTEPKP